ncbi:MAG: hypothetical protein HYX94_11940 [Chloroflexi bacterium]|nr:hypothetical protein [Chloroflexota bacterium]
MEPPVYVYYISVHGITHRRGGLRDGGTILEYVLPLRLSTNQAMAMIHSDEGNEVTRTVEIANMGVGSLEWTSTLSPAVNRLSVSPASGAVSSGSTATATLTFLRPDLPSGWSTGAVAIDSNDGSGLISVTAYVGDVQRLRFPLVYC